VVRGGGAGTIVGIQGGVYGVGGMWGWREALVEGWEGRSGGEEERSVGGGEECLPRFLGSGFGLAACLLTEWGFVSISYSFFCGH